jgi:tRNA dimethylallyltransferase
MMQHGFLHEVEALYQQENLDLNCPSMKSVGYRQLWLYLAGELSLDEAREKAIIATRQLAKRQYTWLRSWKDAQWYDSLRSESLKQAKAKILSFIEKMPYSEKSIPE